MHILHLIFIFKTEKRFLFTIYFSLEQLEFEFRFSYFQLGTNRKVDINIDKGKLGYCVFYLSFNEFVKVFEKYQEVKSGPKKVKNI